MSCRKWNKRILDSLTPPVSVFVSGARLLNAPTAPPACAHPTAAVQVGGVLIYAMLHSCPAARRLAAAAAIAVVMVCVGLVVVAAAFPLRYMPSLRKLVATSPPPCISEGNASHTPTLVRASVWRSRSAQNPPPPPTPPPSQRRRRPPRELSPPSPQMTASTCRAVEAAAHPHRHRVEGRERRTEGELTGC